MTALPLAVGGHSASVLVFVRAMALAEWLNEGLKSRDGGVGATFDVGVGLGVGVGHRVDRWVLGGAGRVLVAGAGCWVGVKPRNAM